MSDLVDRLRGLYADIKSLGEPIQDDEDYSHEQAILDARMVLKTAGFTEGASEAADEIERLREEHERLRNMTARLIGNEITAEEIRAALGEQP